jgi:hypothetical protein
VQTRNAYVRTSLKPLENAIQVFSSELPIFVPELDNHCPARKTFAQISFTLGLLAFVSSVIALVASVGGQGTFEPGIGGMAFAMTFTLLIVTPISVVASLVRRESQWKAIAIGTLLAYLSIPVILTSIGLSINELQARTNSARPHLEREIDR